MAPTSNRRKDLPPPDLEPEIDIDVSKIVVEPPSKPKLSSERRTWIAISWLFSFYIPDFLLSWGGLKDPESRQAWREKYTLCTFVVIASAVLLFWLEGFSSLLCPPEEAFPPVRNISNLTVYGGNIFFINGKIYDPSKASNSIATKLNGNFNGRTPANPAGFDASSLFPKYVYLYRPSSDDDFVDSDIQACVRDKAAADNFMAYRMSLERSLNVNPSTGRLRGCRDPAEYPNLPPITWDDYNGVKNLDEGNDCYYGPSDEKELEALYDSELLHPGCDYENDDLYVSNYFFCIYDKVYDLRYYLEGASVPIYDSYEKDSNTPLTPSEYVINWSPNSMNTAFFGTSLTKILTSYIGKSITKTQAKEELGDDVVKCLDKMFYAGVIYPPNDQIEVRYACVVSNWILWITTFIAYGIVGLKFLLSLRFSSREVPDYHSSYCMMVVPCYTEGEQSLTKTINSLCMSDYDDERKLLVILCDGYLTGEGNTKPTPRIVLDILAYDGPEPEPCSYTALGEGTAQHNMAKVYCGHHVLSGHRVPYIVVVKVGKPSEKRTNPKPGNRGKRDSQLILLNFLSRLITPDDVIGGSAKVGGNIMMTPLEYEMYRAINDILGVNPRVYEYALMVDADTEVTPDALNRMIAKMKADKEVVALCGETKVANDKSSLTTMLQIYEYFVSHHIGKSFESLFGSVTCLPGCFSLYRIKGWSTINGAPKAYAVHPAVVADYSINKVDTLHLKNLLHLGEDRYLTTLLLKHLSKMKLEFVPHAVCYTIIPDEFSILLSQRRRWINSTFHNLWVLSRITTTCGCCLFSMRFVVFMDLVSTMLLPASQVYLYYAIAQAIIEQSIGRYMIVIFGFAALYALHMLAFMIKFEFQNLGWLIIYLLFSLPVFNIVLPLYAFWHFDDFSWGHTRRVDNKQGELDEMTPEMIAAEEKFDKSPVPIKTLSEWETERMLGSPPDYNGAGGMGTLAGTLNGEDFDDAASYYSALLTGTLNRQVSNAASGYVTGGTLSRVGTVEREKLRFSSPDARPSPSTVDANDLLQRAAAEFGPAGAMAIASGTLGRGSSMRPAVSAGTIHNIHNGGAPTEMQLIEEARNIARVAPNLPITDVVQQLERYFSFPLAAFMTVIASAYAAAALEFHGVIVPLPLQRPSSSGSMRRGSLRGTMSMPVGMPDAYGARPGSAGSMRRGSMSGAPPLPDLEMGGAGPRPSSSGSMRRGSISGRPSSAAPEILTLPDSGSSPSRNNSMRRTNARRGSEPMPYTGSSTDLSGIPSGPGMMNEERRGSNSRASSMRRSSMPLTNNNASTTSFDMGSSDALMMPGIGATGSRPSSRGSIRGTNARGGTNIPSIDSMEMSPRPSSRAGTRQMTAARMAAPTPTGPQDIYDAVTDLVLSSDLTTLTKRHIREVMVERFGASFTDTINAAIKEVISNLPRIRAEAASRG